MIIYDPVSGAAMACADLEDDRLMDGLMYYINSQDVPFVRHFPAQFPPF